MSTVIKNIIAQNKAKYLAIVLHDVTYDENIKKLYQERVIMGHSWIDGQLQRQHMSRGVALPFWQVRTGVYMV